MFTHLSCVFSCIMCKLIYYIWWSVKQWPTADSPEHQVSPAFVWNVWFLQSADLWTSWCYVIKMFQSTKPGTNLIIFIKIIISIVPPSLKKELIIFLHHFLLFIVMFYNKKCILVQISCLVLVPAAHQFDPGSSNFYLFFLFFNRPWKFE